MVIGTKYLAWAIGLIGIVDSVILFFANLSMGFASAMLFIAALLLSVAIMGITYFANGGFPALNLLFV